MKIGTLVFGGGISTLGMSVVERAIVEEHGSAVEVQRFRENDKDIGKIKTMDVLLVSLYWFENILYYLRLLQTLGIDPRKRRPLLIIGGSCAINVRVLHGYFHYAVLGDGEVVIADLLRAIRDGSPPEVSPGVVRDGDFETPNMLLTNPIIPPNPYFEIRDRRMGRIEIARGCRWRCPFCQNGNIKPYREQPLEIIEYILREKIGQKLIGLFAPDRTGHSQFKEIEQLCHDLRKHNTADDARMENLLRIKTISNVKLGIEAFSTETRRRFRKLGDPKMILDGFRHIFDVLRTPKGKSLKFCTVYMIGDLPGEGGDAYREFWELMSEVDKLYKHSHKFTIYMSLSSFAPQPFTPMELTGINPYLDIDINRWWRDSPRFSNIVLIRKGGLFGPAPRLIRQITTRGDERLARALMFFATNGFKIYRSRTHSAGRAVEKVIRTCGVEPEAIWEGLAEGTRLPHHRFIIQPLSLRE